MFFGQTQAMRPLLPWMRFASSLRMFPNFRCKNGGFCLLGQRRTQSTEQHNEKPNDKPLSYTKSKAFQYKASENFRSPEEEWTYPTYTANVVNASIAIFLIYFCVLREENDIDQMLGRDLFEMVPHLEIPMLENEVKRLEAYGIEAKDLRKKVDELKRLEELKENNK